MIQADNEKWMHRCIQLARNGQTGAPPNPMVGAVIVYNGKIIGEGYHRKSGEAHAEVNAINSVHDESLLSKSTLYVSLEPCSHYGKTPPCADLIISKKIPRVVVGCIDPFALVHGHGIEKLRHAGIEVTVGVLENECRELNKHFFTFHKKQRPFITLKWAQSADGFIGNDSKDGKKVFISTPHTLINVHKLRAEHQAIMVGRRTAEIDNPRLNLRFWSGRDPLRIVLDSKGRLNPNLHLFDSTQPTLVVSEAPFEKPASQNLEHFHPDGSSPLLPQLMAELYRRNILSLLVEGGSQLLQSFIDANLWDNIIVEFGKENMQHGVAAPVIPTRPFHIRKAWDRDFLFVHNV